MFPLFTNAALLGGLAALGVPILIHLLLRRKSQRMRFSTIQFFVKKDEQSSRKRKLRNLFLLAMRLIVFALIVLAFSRPFLPNQAGAADTRKKQQLILLLDATASMQAAGPAGTQWKRAKEQARKLISELGQDDQVGIILAASKPHVAVPFSVPSVATRKLDDLEPTAGAGELGEGLNQVQKLLSMVRPGYTPSLCVISDLQRSGVHNLSAAPLPASLAVKVIDLGDRYSPNLAISGLEVESRAMRAANFSLTSYSDDHYSALRGTVKVDGKDHQPWTTSLSPGGSTNLSVQLPNVGPGWHSVEIAITGKDSFPLDDKRFATWLSPEPSRTLVVETRKPPKSFMEETFFVAAALDPTTDTNMASMARFQITKTVPDQLARTLGGQARFDLVVLPGLKDLPRESVNALKSYLQNGGGLILFLNETVSANRYNAELSEILPARLATMQTVQENDPAWRIGTFERRSQVFSIFKESGNGDLGIPEFIARFGLTAQPGCATLAAFDDGVPLVIERTVGSGRVLLINGSADTAWNDWAKHKTYVPFLHSAADYLAGRNRQTSETSSIEFTANSDSDLNLGLLHKSKAFKWTSENRPESAATADDQGILTDLPVPLPGVYSLKDAAGKELRRAAVNLPNSESDLSGLAPGDFERQIVRNTDKQVRPAYAGFFGDESQGKELWRALLFAALCFLLIEPLIANRTIA